MSYSTNPSNKALRRLKSPSVKDKTPRNQAVINELNVPLVRTSLSKKGDRLGIAIYSSSFGMQSSSHFFVMKL